MWDKQFHIVIIGSDSLFVWMYLDDGISCDNVVSHVINVIQVVVGLETFCAAREATHILFRESLHLTGVISHPIVM